MPTVAGLWWKRANLVGGVAALVAGIAVYVVTLTGVVNFGLAPIVAALLASSLAMLAGGLLGREDSPDLLHQIAALHD